MALFDKKAKRNQEVASGVEEPEVVDVIGANDDSGRKRSSRGGKSKAGKKGRPPEPSASTDPNRKMTRAEKRAEKNKVYEFSFFPFLSAFKPKEKYVFHSDYFDVDTRVASIMSFFHTEGATDNFGAFWGVNKVPSGLDNDIQVILFEQTRNMTESWVSDHQSKAEGLSDMSEKEQNQAGTNTTRSKARRKQGDLEEIAHELQDGAKYMQVHFRLMVIAPTLEKLDEAVSKIERAYIDRFATLTAAPYMGEQRKELSTLFQKNDKKEGKGFYFTSTEYAGHYNLVTHGLEDPKGEYVGYMVGDVNNSAVLLDTNGYEHHVVIADDNFGQKSDRVHVTALWGSKLSQSCMLNNGRVVHLVLDGTNLDKIGPKFQRLTSKIDMNHGDVNMFEMFGDREDQLSIFSAHMQKLILMAEQAYESTPADRSIIRGSLEEIATKYYVDNRMWYLNAKENWNKLRIVGIPHDEVPKLEMFCSYLDTEYKAMVNRSARDNEKLHALSVLNVTFKNLLSNNGDLFNTTTNPDIDRAQNGRRVIYDFSKLMQRGTGIAMAQLVNIIGFAVGNLGLGDTVIVHGADQIDDSVKVYVTSQFDRLFGKGGRVVFLYNKTDRMLKDKEFSQFDKADFIILGTMTEAQVKDYQTSIGQKIPADLAKLVTQKNVGVSYVRRGFDNIVFHRDLLLGCSDGKNRRRA